MAFPDDAANPLTVEALMGGQWRDLSSRLEGDPVTIRRGKPDGARQVAAGSCRLILDDDDGALTPLNPIGEYYPYVRRGVPFRLSYDRAIETFTGRTSVNEWGTASDGKHQWAIAGTAANFDVASGVGTVVLSSGSQYVTTGEYGGALEVLAKMSVSSLTGDPEFGIVTHFTDSSNTWRFGIRTSGTDSVVVQKVIGGVGAVWASNVPTIVAGTSYWLRVLAGRRLRLRFWEDGDPEPSTWNLDVWDNDPFTQGLLPLVGAAGMYVQGAGGNTVTFDDIQIDCWRFHGTAGSYRPRLVPTTDGTLRAVQQIEVGGILRRLGQRNKPLRSPLFRALSQSSPVAWWPLEDGTDSTQAASGIVGGSPLSVTTGVIKFSTDAPAGAAGSAQPNLGSGSYSPTQFTGAMQGSVTGCSSTSWQVSVWARGLSSAAGASFVPLQWRNSTYIYRVWWQNTTDSFVFTLSDATNDTGAIEDIAAPLSVAGDALDGEWHLAQVTVEESGADSDVALYVDGVLRASGTWTGRSVDPITSVQSLGAITGFDPTINMAEANVTHFAIHNGVTLVDLWDAGQGHVGETAGDRADRLCDEEGITLTVVGSTAETARMGVQPLDTLVNVVRESETADLGILAETVDVVGLGFQARHTIYNQNPALVVDLSTYRTSRSTSRQVLTPVYDDQGLVNDVVASRVDGSSARVLDQQSIDADELFDEAVEVNLENDTDLPDYASWLVHIGTIDEYRNPSLAVDLAANPDLIAQWLSCDIGSRVHRTNPPYPHPPETIDQLLDGYTETIGPKSWTVSANCSPAAPWNVFVLDTDRLDHAGSTLSSGETTTGTSWEPTTPASSALWSTTSEPYDLVAAGERVTVTAMTGTSSPQIATVTRSVNTVVKAHNAGETVQLADRRVLGL